VTCVDASGRAQNEPIAGLASPDKAKNCISGKTTEQILRKNSSPAVRIGISGSRFESRTLLKSRFYAADRQVG